MDYSLKNDSTLLEKHILSYAYHIEECKISFQTSASAVS